MSQLHKLDHKDTILLFQWLWEELVNTNNQLANTLQYMDENIHNIAEKTETKLSELKKNIAEVQQNAGAIFDIIKGNEPTKEWRKATKGASSYVS
jgi:asparagine synthetase A